MIFKYVQGKLININIHQYAHIREKTVQVLYEILI